MWVVEMEAFMADTTGRGENTPNGRIVILEDRDQDGRADHRQVFLNSLIMPRAICWLGKGLLVAEPPRLWYVEIKNDRPGRRTLLDDHYTEGGNVESQANGLYRALDNWIYSGGSDKRYRLKGGQWRTERTHLRGQWGLSQDDQGRLYYNNNNNNNQNLLGDIRHARSNKDVLLLQKQFPRGTAVFRSTCQPCHGADGNGVPALAPPLNRSEWVTGDKDKLMSIVLFGLTGPVKVNGTLYQSPEISGDMPGLGHNQDLVNEDLAQLLSFIRNSWGNNAGKVSDEDILRLRQKYKGRQKAFTAAELDARY
jgi:mono/diheme cytochrome c family protein